MPLPSENALTFRSDDPAKWGTGKGAPLTKEEADNNIWQLLLYIAELQNNEAQPKEIQSITVTDNQMTITLSDGVTTFGPFDLKAAAFRWTGAFVGGQEYQKFDIFTANDGAYLVLQDHTAATTFDPDATTMSGALYALMFAFQNIYDIGFFYPGKPGAGVDVDGAMFAFRFTRDAFLPADLGGSEAGFMVEPVDGAWSVDIQKNGSVIGTYTFDPATSSSEASSFFDFPDDIQFNAGDVLAVIRPASLDSAAVGFSMTLAAKKGTLS